VQTWRDVVEELPSEVKCQILAAERNEQPATQMAMDAVALSDTERKILSLVKADEAVHIDLLLMKSGLGSGELMMALMNLEMMGRIKQLPGKSFVRVL
jgi:DNA processing protein